jgi:hypothetical protein
MDITNNKIWGYGYKPETEQQSFLLKSSSPLCPKKARQVHFSILIVFLTSTELLPYKFMPQGKTMNKHFHSNVMQHLREDKFPVKNNMNAVPHSVFPRTSAMWLYALLPSEENSSWHSR